MVSAILFDAPSQVSIAVESLSRSPSAAFMMARNPDMAFLPTSASAVLAFSDSESFENASRQSMMISAKGRIVPSALEVCITTSPSLSPESFISPLRLVIMVLSAVPAWVDLIPALAIRPMARAVSSAEYPSAPAIGAAYLKVSPIIDTLVLAFDEAAARISAKCPESLALRPKAVRASVTISEVVARSSPDAAARFMMPSMPSSISPVFQPAMAMYSKAAPASEAENLVMLPISRAFSRRASNSSPVAPEIAETLLICSSKSAVVFTAAAPTATIGAVTAVESVFPTPDILFPTFSRALPALSSFVKASFALAASLSSFCSVAMISLCRASYLSFPRSPFSIWLLACSWAVLSASSLSFVAEMESFRSDCFWARSWVFVGSSFKRRSTSLSWLCVFFIVLLTDSRALFSPVTLPFISTVIPAILEAILPYLLFPDSDAIKNGRWNRSTLHVHNHSLPSVEVLLGGQCCVFHAVVAFLSPDIKHKTDREKVKIRNGNPDLHTSQQEQRCSEFTFGRP